MKQKENNVADIFKTARQWAAAGSRLEENPDNVQNALYSYKKALEMDKSLIYLYTDIGVLYYRMNDFNSARYYFELGMAAGASRAPYNLGLVEFKCGNFKKAVNLFEISFKKEKDSSSSFNLAMSLLEDKKEKEAVKYFKTFLELKNTGKFADVARKKLEYLKEKGYS